MISFASFVEEQAKFEGSFSEWMQVGAYYPMRLRITHRFCVHRREWRYGSKCPISWGAHNAYLFLSLSQVRYMRRSQNLKVFAPVADLSAISKVEAARNHEVSVAGGQVLGDEWTEHVVKVSIYLVLGLWL